MPLLRQPTCRSNCVYFKTQPINSILLRPNKLFDQEWGSYLNGRFRDRSLICMQSKIRLVIESKPFLSCHDIGVSQSRDVCKYTVT